MYVIMLTGCVQSIPVKKSVIQKAPKWEQLVEGSSLKMNVNYKYYPSEMKLNNNMLLREKKWDGFLQKFILSFPVEERDDILRGLTRFHKDYDRVEKLIKFEPLRYSSGPYSSNSYVSVKGSLDKKGAIALLKIQYYGSSWLFANSITIVADDFTWRSSEVEFFRDNTGGVVWEYAFLDLSNPKYRTVVNKIISSKEVIIRFQGKQYYKDLDVTERMKKDIASILKTIDTVNGK